MDRAHWIPIPVRSFVDRRRRGRNQMLQIRLFCVPHHQHKVTADPPVERHRGNSNRVVRSLDDIRLYKVYTLHYSSAKMVTLIFAPSQQASYSKSDQWDTGVRRKQVRQVGSPRTAARDV